MEPTPITILRYDAKHDMPENFVTVLVAGGLAHIGPDGLWYSGPGGGSDRRQLDWTPMWWAYLISFNDSTEDERSHKRTREALRRSDDATKRIEALEEQLERAIQRINALEALVLTSSAELANLGITLGEPIP